MPSTPTELPALSQHSPNIQTVGDNISIPHSQSIDITNTESSLEFLAILYNDNQLADPDL